MLHDSSCASGYRHFPCPPMVTKTARIGVRSIADQPRAKMPATARNQAGRETLIASTCAAPLLEEAAGECWQC